MGRHQNQEQDVPHILWKRSKIVENGCREWIGGKDEDGYGLFKVHTKSVRAHRKSYELFHGPIPDGLVVMHSCDNPSCILPSHLSVGTYKQNTQDAVSKNRMTRKSAKFSESSNRNRFNLETANRVRSDFASGSFSQRELAKKYNMSFQNVHLIVARKIWNYEE